MKFIRKHKKISIIFLSFLCVFLLIQIAFGKYIYNVIHNYILETKGFYFNSSILSIQNKNYNIRNWDGVNAYPLTIDLNNRKNIYTKTETDIEYQVTLNCSSNVTCSSTKNSGVIYQNTGNDSFIVTMLPNQNFSELDEAVVSISVKSITPYQKTLSATYHIGIEKSKFSYSITDTEGSIYMTLEMTNSLTYYKAMEDFSTYHVGDKISLEDYDSLSVTDKAKCYSAHLTLSFNPNVLTLDMTADAYHKRKSGSETTQMIGSNSYVSGFEFYIPAASSAKIIFYKADRYEDYTFPIVNDTSIVNLTIDLAEQL